MWKNNYRIAYRIQNRPCKPLSTNAKESFVKGKRFAEEDGMETVMDNINAPGNGSPPETETEMTGSTLQLGAGQANPAKGKRKMKRHCPVCSKRLYQDSSERWYCPHCLAEVDGDRISFNYVPEGELDTLLQTG